jgi:RNA polymerase sigma-70 factor (ECF subfamily)
MYRIALNVARDFRRRDQRRPTVPFAQDVPSSAPTAAEQLARNETAESVAAAIATLPDPLREILVLKHFGKLSFNEISLATDLPPSTVKSRLLAALKQLRGELRRRGFSELE